MCECVSVLVYQCISISLDESSTVRVHTDVVREAEERDEILEERVGPAEQHTPDDDRIENPHVRQALV